MDFDELFGSNILISTGIIWVIPLFCIWLLDFTGGLSIGNKILFSGATLIVAWIMAYVYSQKG
jgi:hypothetical protein